MEVSVIDLVIVAIAALVYSLLDKKFEWLRMGPLYREQLWQNYIVNFVVVAIIYVGIGYFL